ncbi:MAG: hypothetical protein WBR29_07420 [Gammaproteobacteria bacterium]
MNTTVMERPPLVSVVGTVVHMSAAPAANRSGKIKLDNGAILSAFPDKLQQIAEGHVYDFGCVETNKLGVIYRDVKTVRLIPQPEVFRQHSTPPRSQSARQTPAPAQRSAPVNAHVDPPHNPQPQNGNGGPFYKATHPRDARRMWVSKMLGDLVQAHQVTSDKESIRRAIIDLCELYEETPLGDNGYGD